MNKTPSRASWRYMLAGIILIIATMAGGSAVANDYGRSSRSATVSDSTATNTSWSQHWKHHWKKRHHHKTPAPSPTASTPPQSPPVESPGEDPEDPPSSPTGPVGGDFPNAVNTGVPSGTTLSAYTGPMRITVAGTIIDSKTIQGRLDIAAGNVTIKNSKLNGTIDSDSSGSRVTIIDSEIDGGNSEAPSVGYGGITMKRVDVHGARVSVLCGSNCDISDSWLHDQYLKPGSAWHVNGYLSNGGSNVVVKHNTLECKPQNNNNGGGCTGPAASFGDFGALNNITYDSNLFVAGPGSYCLYAGNDNGKPYGANPTNVTVSNNVFQRGPNRKCAYYGAVTSFKSGGGNVWSNNKWDDGAVLNP